MRTRSRSPRRAEELGQDVQAYCNDMARQFREVWDALEISYDEFVQTSEPRHHHCARTFIQKVYDNGYIRKDKFEGWYCNGCEAFKTEQEVKEARGACPLHPNTPLIRRSEDCYYFEQSRFRDRLLKLYEERPDFIQPESRRNEIIALVKEGLQDLNITRTGETWGIRVPWDERFTIYVWFDALLTYITGIGYGSDEAKFRKWWPCRHPLHRQGHHPLPLRHLAGDAPGGRTGAAEDGVRARLRLSQGRCDRRTGPGK